MRKKNDIRIFFALWPDAVTRQRLARRARAIPLERPARRVPDNNLHLTLHFIGNVLFDDLACLQQAARKVVANRFEFVIDSYGFFRRARVAWLGMSEVPEELDGLYRDLGDQLQTCGFNPESRPYSPHVTVARKLNRATELADIEPVRWQVDKFVLVESRATDNGVNYEPIETYSLA